MFLCAKIVASFSLWNRGYKCFYLFIGMQDKCIIIDFPETLKNNGIKWTKMLLRPIRHTCLHSTANTTHYWHPLRVSLLSLLHSSGRKIFAPLSHGLLSVLDTGLGLALQALVNFVPPFLSWISKARLPRRTSTPPSPVTIAALP